MFFQNFGTNVPGYTEAYPRTLQYEYVRSIEQILLEKNISICVCVLL
jgi:hypothetical protein